MQYFKRTDGTVCAFEADGSQDKLIPEGAVPISGQDLQDALAALSPPPTAPESISMRQARLALLSAGLLANIAPAIDALPSPQKEAALIEWEYATEVRRDNALLQALAPALGLDAAALDALFTAAATL